jgi:type II secretory ATPase GspE/PulE/Tfp pilus assembly ATPase PilB-like protein
METMSDLSSPTLSLAPLAEPLPGADTPLPNIAFTWPTPPYAAYPASVLLEPLAACEIEGLNGKIMQAQLIKFDVDSESVQVQVPPARAPISLRFAQFRRLTLCAELAPLAGPGHNDLLAFHPPRDFRVALTDGTELSGKTVGHVEHACGLFLFPPVDSLPQDTPGTVRRMFCPRPVYMRYEIGPRLDKLLVADETATPEQLAAVVSEHARMQHQNMGDVMLSTKVVSAEQMAVALAAQSKMKMVRIGEALLALGFVDQSQLDDALQLQRGDRSVPLGELLVQRGHIQRQDLRTALARKMGYPVVDVDAFPVEADALRRVPMPAALRMNVLPLQLLPGRLVLAIDDPSRRETIDELEFIAQCKVVPVLATTDALAASIQAIYVKQGLADFGQPAAGEPSGPGSFDSDGTDKLLAALEQQPQDKPDEDQLIEQADSSLVRLINTMIVEAHGQGVSDIHIETRPGREKVRVRFRRDGGLKPYLELPHTYRAALIARIKIMCDLDISERRRPQDGKINFARFVPSCAIELRVATIPTANGLEDAVMRILTSARPLPLDGLGMSPNNLEALKAAIQRPYGMVLCVGPTGSGKTTTLHSALSYINTPDRKIWTAEDPVEITQPGLRQVQVNPKIDWTFAKALRAFLRADPDVIMVGEIRDSETAHIAVESSLTGHLVLSTLHTNSAAETITRLLDMGMDPFNFADSLLAVLAQRLVRRLCAKCVQSAPANAEQVEERLGHYMLGWTHASSAPSTDNVLADWRARFGRDSRLQHFHSPGCAECEGSGRRGRAGIHELLTVTKPIRRLIQTKARAEEIQDAAMAEGLRTLRQDGIEKVLAGVTTIEEVRATSNA